MYRLREFALQVTSNVEECGSPRPAVEVLVPASHREVDAPLVERGGHNARGVAQIPHRERASGMHDLGDRGHVSEPGGAVGDGAEERERCIGPDRVSDKFGRDSACGNGVYPAHGESTVRRNALDDVAVGRKVVSIDHDLGATGTGIQCRSHELVDRDGR